jgi:heme A synthase
MSSKNLLRIAAVVILLHSFGHTAGLLTWQAANGDVPSEVVQKMQEVQFSFMFKNGCTMADFYSGAACCGTLFLLLVAVMLWTLSGRKDTLTINLLWIIAMAIVLLGVIEIVYFFPFAVSFCIIAAALVFMAIFKLNHIKEL